MSNVFYVHPVLLCMMILLHGSRVRLHNILSLKKTFVEGEVAFFFITGVNLFDKKTQLYSFHYST